MAIVGRRDIRYPTSFGFDCRVSSTSQGQLLKAIKHRLHLGCRRQAEGSECVHEGEPIYQQEPLGTMAEGLLSFAGRVVER
jgi:hypothetical protein